MVDTVLSISVVVVDSRVAEEESVVLVFVVVPDSGVVPPVRQGENNFVLIVKLHFLLP